MYGLRMLVDILFYLFQLFNHILVDTGEVLCLALQAKSLTPALALTAKSLALKARSLAL